MRLDRSCWKRLLLGTLLAILMSACQVELYGDLSENEANEMIALLQRSSISVEKKVGKKQSVSLLIAEADFARAMEVMKRHGLPRKRFSNLGEVFKKEGMVSSPTEERARFLYARSQELSQTLNDIQGVLSARVHVVLPQKKNVNGEAVSASASVFIRHRAEYSFDAYIPKIKRLISNGIEGLNYENVAVALFPIEFEEMPSDRSTISQYGLWLSEESVWRLHLMLLLAMLAGMLVAAVAAAGIWLWRGRQGKSAANDNPSAPEQREAA
ncbi:type III secretion system inner membrane ring lipoprotein SctJ [Aestuariispira insulae]|uniref:Lipoprotein n=1 Tax=Aestuariispira insulae TaxID=1461337 RepID=A0A3D9H2M2_9PROT|nr:type III secretion inner membrane ring lipoprotein SctJ [Aestuariispira insulae]RED43730.1 type III secretion protein J [Aestuariispira insulae]